MISSAQLQQVISLIKSNDWHAAHEIAQSHNDPTANWLHAVLHKIEGDVTNSHYWYAKTKGIHFDKYPDLAKELVAISQSFC